MKRQKHRQHFATLLLPLVILMTTFCAEAQNEKQQSVPEIAFTVSLPKPHTHMLDVEMRVTRGVSQQVPKEELRLNVTCRTLLPLMLQGSRSSGRRSTKIHGGSQAMARVIGAPLIEFTQTSFQ